MYIRATLDVAPPLLILASYDRELPISIPHVVASLQLPLKKTTLSRHKEDSSFDDYLFWNVDIEFWR